MCWNDVVFCPDGVVNGLTANKVVDALAGENKIFPVRLKEVFLTRYEKMREHFLDSCVKNPDFWDQDDGLRLANTRKIRGKRQYKDALLEMPASYQAFQRNAEWKDILKSPCVGHDMPVWMHGPKPQKDRRIMIVSQDPLRKGHHVGKLLLSTPFGYHSAAYRGNGFMMKLALCLMEEGCTLYFTDYRKIYSGPKDKINPEAKCHCKGCPYMEECLAKFDEYNKCKKAINQRFAHRYHNCLLQEVKLFKPAAVLLLGGDVLQMAANEFSFEGGVGDVGLVKDGLPRMAYLGSPTIGNETYRFYTTCHPTGTHLSLKGDEKLVYYRTSIINALTQE